MSARHTQGLHNLVSADSSTEPPVGCITKCLRGFSSRYPLFRFADKSPNLVPLDAALHGSWKAVVSFLKLRVPSPFLFGLLPSNHPRHHTLLRRARYAFASLGIGERDLGR